MKVVWLRTVIATRLHDDYMRR